MVQYCKSNIQYEVQYSRVRPISLKIIGKIVCLSTETCVSSGIYSSEHTSAHTRSLYQQQFIKLKDVGTPSCVDWTSSRTLDRVCCSTWLGSTGCTFSCVTHECPRITRCCLCCCHRYSDLSMTVKRKTRPTCQKNPLWFPHCLLCCCSHEYGVDVPCLIRQ